MRHNLKVIATMLLLAVTLAAWADGLNIVPQPLRVSRCDGEFVISVNTRIVCQPQLRQEAEWLADALRASTGLPLTVGSGGGTKGAISLVIDTVAVTETEGYSLSVSAKGVSIKARTGAGAFYAMQTLMQLLPRDAYSSTVRNGVRWSVPAADIYDAPAYKWRGLMLDVSRYFHDSDFLRSYIDMMAAYKLNVLQLHLVDDAGWRLEIKKYPLLTEVGAWAGDDVHRLGGYYTQQEMRELVAYAARRGVTIVPEIELPAHMLSAIVAYPWLSCRRLKNEVQTQGTISEQIMCAGNEDCYKFLEDVFDEVCDIFPSHYVNIGGDEANYVCWKSCPRCQDLKQRLGLKDESQMQGYVTNRVIAILKRHGRTVVGWNEIAERGELHAPVVANCWHEPEKATELIAKGNYALLSPVEYCYFDMPESSTPGEVQAATWSRPVSVEQVYALKPDTYCADGRMLGVQACLWSDQFIVGTRLQEIDALNENRSEHYIEYLTYPRAIALSEVGWTASSRRDYADFTRRLATQYAVLDLKGCHYRVPEPVVSAVKNDDGTTTVTLTPSVLGARMRYRTDGRYPNVHSTEYTAPVRVRRLSDFLAITEVSPRHFSLPVCPAGIDPYSGKYGKKVGVWSPDSLRDTTFVTLRIPLDIEQISQSGDYTATFVYQNGSVRLEIKGVRLYCNGELISADYHPGVTGATSEYNAYRLNVQWFERLRSYVLEADVRGDIGPDSRGNIYLRHD